MRTRKPANPRRLAETAWRHSSSRSRRNIFMFGFLSDARCSPVSWRNASGLEGAVIKHVLDHVVNCPYSGSCRECRMLGGSFHFLQRH